MFLLIHCIVARSANRPAAPPTARPMEPGTSLRISWLIHQPTAADMPTRRALSSTGLAFRGVRVVAWRDSVRGTPPTVGSLNSHLAAPQISDDASGAADSVVLGVVVAAGSPSLGAFHVPTSFGVMHHISVVLGHRSPSTTVARLRHGLYSGTVGRRCSARQVVSRKCNMEVA